MIEYKVLSIIPSQMGVLGHHLATFWEFTAHGPILGGFTAVNSYFLGLIDV